MARNAAIVDFSTRLVRYGVAFQFVDQRLVSCPEGQPFGLGHEHGSDVLHQLADREAPLSGPVEPDLFPPFAPFIKELFGTACERDDLRGGPVVFGDDRFLPLFSKGDDLGELFFGVSHGGFHAVIVSHFGDHLKRFRPRSFLIGAAAPGAPSRRPTDLRGVAREAGAAGGSFKTPLVQFEAAAMTLNLEAPPGSPRGVTPGAPTPRGEVALQILDEHDRPVRGFTGQDCQPVSGDALAAPPRSESRRDERNLPRANTASGLAFFRHQHSHLSLARIQAALGYYHDHKTKLDAQIQRSVANAERLRAEAGESPLWKRLCELAKPA